MSSLRGFFRNHLGAVALAVALCLTSSGAFADNKTAARASAGAGIADYEAGRFAEALKRFEKAEELVHAPPHLLYIARARVKLGNLVDAREAYLSLINEVLPGNAPPAFVEAQEAARPELAELEPRIPKITVTVTGGEDAELVLNGVNVGSGLVGLPYPIDPGKHVVSVVTPTSASEEQTVEVTEGADLAVTLTLVEKVVPEQPTAASEVEVKDTTAPPKKSSVRPVLLYGGFGLGVLGIGVGSVTGLLAIKEVKSVKDEFGCDDDGVCDSAGSEGALKSAHSLELISTIGFAAGAVGVGLGIVGLLMDDPKEESVASRRHKVLPLFGEVNGVAVVGEF